jgi:hypothetical protein
MALAVAAASAFIAGITAAFAPELGEKGFWSLQVAFGVLDSFLLFAWVQYDRRELGVPRSTGFNLALAWFSAITVPIHFARHRPVGKRGLPIVLFLLAISIGYLVLLVAGAVCGIILHLLTVG